MRRKIEKPTTNNTKLQSPEDSENKTPQPKQLGEKLPTPWYTPWSKQKTPPGKGGVEAPLPGDQQSARLYSEETHTRDAHEREKRKKDRTKYLYFGA
jgi:hypothetical protein